MDFLLLVFAFLVGFVFFGGIAGKIISVFVIWWNRQTDNFVDWFNDFLNGGY